MYLRSTKLVTLAKVREGPRTKFVLIALELIKLLSVNGDGEIRTLDPLLARQVLSQLSYAPIWVTYLIIQSHSASGLEKTRTSDLTLIRRAL